MMNSTLVARIVTRESGISRTGRTRTGTGTIRGGPGVTALMVLLPGLICAPLSAAQVLDEIVVTAQKVEESLQDVPLSITAFDDSYIRDTRLESFDGLAARIPGMGFNAPFKSQVQPVIRGAASLEDSPGADQGVAIFVDEVYVGQTSTFDFDMFDMERIEVLKGPQGTVFGRNTVGGAISIITRRPTEKFSADLDLTYGRFDQLDAKGRLNVPITDRLFSSIAFSSRNSDGYVRNTITGNRLEANDINSVRGKLLFDATDSLEILLSLDYTSDNSEGIARPLVGTSVPFAPPQDTNDFDVNHLDVDGQVDRETFAATLRATLDTGYGEWVSVTGYRDHNDWFRADADGTPEVLLLVDPTTNRIEQFSQELRFSHEGQRLDWLVGGYYLNVEHERLENLTASGGPGSFLGGLFGGLTFREQFGQDIETDSYALFGQSVYAVTDRLNLTVGGRYSWEEKEGDTICEIILIAGLNCGVNYVQPVQESWGAFTPRASLDFAVREDAMVYFTVSRGFKSGGFASGFATTDGADVPFDPEYAWNYEGGIKSRWLGDRLQLNAAVFHVDYTDLQVRQFDPVNPARIIIGNAGEADVTGVEVDSSAILFSNMEVWANYAYQDGEYQSLVLEGTDLSGNRLPLTPKHSLSIGARYHWRLGELGTLRLAGDLLYKDRAFLFPDNDPNQMTHIDALINANLTYISPSSNWEVSIWGQNLRDERTTWNNANFSAFYHSLAALGAGAQTFATRLSMPRTYGVTARFRFD